MLFPNKHLKLSESVFCVGALIIQLLTKPQEVENLWKEFEPIIKTDKLPAYHSYDDFLLAIDFLFLIEAIDLDNEGKLYICN